MSILAPHPNVADSAQPVTGRNRPIRVMHLLYSLGVGGMEQGVRKLLDGLDPAIVVSSVCSLASRPPGSEWPTDSRVMECGRRDSGNDLFVMGRLYRLFRRWRPDVVHTHAWGTLCEGVLAARAARVPF